MEETGISNEPEPKDTEFEVAVGFGERDAASGEVEDPPGTWVFVRVVQYQERALYYLRDRD